MKKEKESKDYVNNKEFYQMLIAYKEECKEAEEKGKPQPRIPENIGKCFYLIATRLANKGNFIGYTYKDEMISDGLENCITAIHSFKPEKSANPFAYFTRIIWWAFVRRIDKEKKQTYIKYKQLEKLVVDSDLIEEEGGNGYANYDLINEKMKPIIDKFETTVKKKKENPKGLEKFTK